MPSLRVRCRAFGFDAEPSGSMGLSLSASLACRFEAVAIQNFPVKPAALHIHRLLCPFRSSISLVCALCGRCLLLLPRTASHCSYKQFPVAVDCDPRSFIYHMPVPVCEAMFKPGCFSMIRVASYVTRPALHKYCNADDANMVSCSSAYPKRLVSVPVVTDERTCTIVMPRITISE